MRRALAGIAACAVVVAASPAVAEDRGAVVASTPAKFAMRDSRGDARAEGVAATRSTLRAADVRRVEVRQRSRFGIVRVTVTGSVRARGVRRWAGWAYFAARDVAVDRIVTMELTPTRAMVHVYSPDGSQMSCRGTVAVSNHGRTVTARAPRACRWFAVRLLHVDVTSDRGEQIVSRDHVWARCRLNWH